MEEIPLLELNEDVLFLASKLVQGGPIPESAKEDALHISLATVHGMDYILTWNCSHLANAHLTPKLRFIMEAMGYHLPQICTPEELMEEWQ